MSKLKEKSFSPVELPLLPLSAWYARSSLKSLPESDSFLEFMITLEWGAAGGGWKREFIVFIEMKQMKNILLKELSLRIDQFTSTIYYPNTLKVNTFDVYNLIQNLLQVRIFIKDTVPVGIELRYCNFNFSLFKNNLKWLWRWIANPILFERENSNFSDVVFIVLKLYFNPHMSFTVPCK